MSDRDNGTALTLLINQALERRGWSGRSLRDLAAESGGRLSKDVVAMYRTGRHPAAPSEPILQAWKDLTGLPLSELRAAARLAAGEDELGAYVPPVESVRLNRRQRAAVDELIRAFVGGPVESGEARR